jgi:curved DNA-binding protein CbpA
MAERNPYAVLGVRREAGEAEIHDAYRKLAKRHHPDLHADDPLAEGRFKEIAAAYDVLSHKDKRARLDRSGADAAAASDASFAHSNESSRARQGGKASDGSRSKPQFGFGAWAVLCLLLAVLAIIFAWAGADDRMVRWGGIEIPNVAIFFLFIAAALLVIRTIGRVLSPDDAEDP